MPLTPQQALARSEAARLSDEDKALYATIIERMEAAIVARFNGAALHMKIEACSPAIAARIARAFQQAGWVMQMQAADGTFGKAEDLIRSGAPVEWMVAIVPDWTRENGGQRP